MFSDYGGSGGDQLAAAAPGCHEVLLALAGGRGVM